jgi:putative transcriptional regulator
VNIQHHLDPATVMAYAAGTLGEALSVAAASHMAWCPACRAAAREAEQLGGEIVAGLDAAPVSNDCRARTLSNLDQATLHRFPRPPAPPKATPAPLERLLDGMPLDRLAWKRKGPGVEMFDLPLSRAARGKLVLMRIAAGKSVPDHGHGGEEITLILSGAYSDRFGHYAVGDVADLDEDAEHKPMVDATGPCICLVATEAPTRFKSWPARLLQPIIGI